MKDDLPQLSQDLIASIPRDEITDLGASLGDIAMDLVVTDGLIDGVPVLGALVQLTKAGKAIRDQIFLTKVIRFLASFGKEANRQDRDEFVGRLEAKGQTKHFGETIILLLDRMDDLEKPVIVGRLMAAAARNKLDLADAFRLSRIVDKAHLEDLKALPNFADGKRAVDTPLAEQLYLAGLLTTWETGSAGSGRWITGGNISFRRNRYADLLLEHGLQSSHFS